MAAHVVKVLIWDLFERRSIRIIAAMSRFLVVIALLFLSACAGPAPEAPARIAVFGDSMMAWNGGNRASAPHRLSALLDEPVANYAMSGARITHPFPISSLMGFDIRRQYRKGDWEIILVNGGANDFFFECGCGFCGRTLNRLIAEDGQSGALPDFLRKLRGTNAQVIYVGYHRSRGLNGPVKACRDELDALDMRVAELAEAEAGIDFVALNDVFPVGDARYYAPDRVHPSRRGSAAIAARLKGPVERALASRAPE